MRPSLLAAAATLLITAACSVANGSDADRTSVRPSGITGQRSFAAEGFDRVSLSAPFDLVLTVGSNHSVRAEGDSGLIDHLDITVRDGNLRVAMKEGSYVYGDAARVTIHVSAPALRAASVAGSGDMKVSAFRAADFEGAVAGSGNLLLERLDADSVTFAVAGSGNLRGSGSARSAKVNVAGSGNAVLSAFQTNRAEIAIAGSGNAELRATGEADVRIAGSGNLDLTGGARCSVRTVGSGSARCN